MPTPPRPALYRIGEVAERTGLSVRTLHHYDAEGLLTPSARTEAGHRRYADADIARLQRIVSLRGLGLGLAEVRAALDDVDPVELLERHLAALRARIEDGQRLAARIDALSRHLRHTGAASVEDLFHLIHLTTMFETHYTPDQLEQLRQREAALGPDQIEAVQQQWTDLFAEFDRHRVAGADPAAPEVQALARQAETLIGAFTGGDSGIRASLENAYQENRAEMTKAWGIDPELGAYYHRAMSADRGA